MRKTNKNLTKQILTLMLAFVMVFTGMGIGSWGVDKVWATGIDLGIDDIVKGGGQLIGTCDIDPYEDDDISVYDVYLKSIKAYADMISISSKEWYLYSDFEFDTNYLYVDDGKYDAIRESAFVKAGKATYEENISKININEGIELSNDADHLLLLAFNSSTEKIF